ncbi:hypothetical protein PF008_g15046 [Phytophthora fragariae]|uniref:Protein kinase domain-containing protein n=1 Tax=Phytophthora fragariae TaxID=53985 RepID=A0A6G0RFA5_9STRA|nr:hypothetical protein PF008_g15046 [Phytophthora fragariae]
MTGDHTITLRSLETDSSPPSNDSFVFDGTHSDIARQLFIRHQANDTRDRIPLTFVPSALKTRLSTLNIDFDDLPGLVQRAVLWDTGFAIAPGNVPVQIWPVGGHTMANITVKMHEVDGVDCDFTNCSQPNNVTAYYTRSCTGYQMGNTSHCVADVFEDKGARGYLGNMWARGGDPDVVPEIVMRDHTWTEDIAEFGGNTTFSVYVVHTIPSLKEAPWSKCPKNGRYGTVSIPCVRRDHFTDAFMAANTTTPTGSAWVTTWLKDEFGRDESSGFVVIILVILTVVALVGAGWSSISSPTYDSPGSSKTLKILLGSVHLQGKRIPYESLEFDRVLSKGASGEVWLCEYIGQKVAVKKLLQAKTQKAEEVQTFAEEIELSASLVHPNIIEFLGVVWNTLSNLAMVLEFLPTGNLQKDLENDGHNLSWARHKIYMAIGVAQALKYLHACSLPLIHRDIKSTNILLTESLEPKVIDFGISRELVDRTMTGGVGTPYWTAPEILEGERYTEQSDIYSFGVLLSELDTGKIPYHDALTEDGTKMKPFKVLHEVMSGSLRPSFSDECPPRIHRISSACLSPDPQSRPTAQELVQELEGKDADSEEYEGGFI